MKEGKSLWTSKRYTKRGQVGGRIHNFSTEKTRKKLRLEGGGGGTVKSTRRRKEFQIKGGEASVGKVKKKGPDLVIWGGEGSNHEGGGEDTTRGKLEKVEDWKKWARKKTEYSMELCNVLRVQGLKRVRTKMQAGFYRGGRGEKKNYFVSE